jgi:hypothetical protein
MKGPVIAILGGGRGAGSRERVGCQNSVRVARNGDGICRWNAGFEPHKFFGAAEARRQMSRGS